jgi:hypothetical protein
MIGRRDHDPATPEPPAVGFNGIDEFPSHARATVLLCDNEGGELSDILVAGEAGLDVNRGEPGDAVVADCDIGLTPATLAEVEEAARDDGGGGWIA